MSCAHALGLGAAEKFLLLFDGKSCDFFMMRKRQILSPARKFNR
jgi:hypothetical protein